MFRFFLVVLLCGAAFARPQADVDVVTPAVAVDVSTPAVAVDVSTPAVAVDVSTPAVSVDVSTPAVDVATPSIDGSLPSAEATTESTSGGAVSGGGDAELTLTIVLRLHGYDKFVNYVHELGLDHLLNGTTPCTVFAPVNSAIDKLKSLVAADIEFKKNILRSLIIAGNYTLNELKEKVAQAKAGLIEKLKTIKGDDWLPNIYPNGNCVTNGGTIIQPDLNATNGIAHGINDIAVSTAGTIGDDLKNALPALSTAIKNKLPTIVSKLQDAAPKTFVKPSLAEAAAAVASLVQGKVNDVKEKLSKRVIQGAYSWEDLKNLVGQNVTASNGQSYAVNRVDDNTIQIGDMKISHQSSSSIQYSNGFSHSASAP